MSERSDPNEYEHKWIRDFFYGRADRVVLQTDDVLKSFGRKIREKAVVIPNPVDPMLPPAYKGKRKKKICAAARLEPSKDHKTLLRAFYDFQKEFGDYTLEIYGKGSLEGELKAMTKEMGMDAKVNFHGFCPTVREEIRDHAMYILSSKFEGISNALMETLAMGMPVIATDCPVGGSRMCIKDHENGILVPVEDPKALAAAMKELASDEELSQRLARNAGELRGFLVLFHISAQSRHPGQTSGLKNFFKLRIHPDYLKRVLFLHLRFIIRCRSQHGNIPVFQKSQTHRVDHGIFNGFHLRNFIRFSRI